MKDLDFDELDRAVSSLMQDVSTQTTVPKPDDSVTTVSLGTPTTDDQPPASQPAEATPEAPAPSEPASPPDATPVKPRPAPAARRGGRFMDVVHPSSDMKAAPSLISRQGVTIQPRPAAAASPTDTPDTTDQSPAETSDWPDPIEMATPEAPVTPSDEVSSSDAPDPVSEDTPDTAAAAPAPLTSPFLAGAKVEKRPLGGDPTLQSDPVADPLAGNEVPDTTEPVAAQLPAQPEPEQALPEELSSDVIAIESDATTGHKSAEPSPQAAEAAPAASQPTVSVEPDKPTGPVAITQQYKEQPPSGDQTNGAIYDTDSYHQPLAHPAKKKSGWLIVVWIVVVLALGAAAGAGVYLLNWL